MKGRTRCLLTMAIATGIVLAAAGSAPAQTGGILTSKHNLTYSSNNVRVEGSGATTEVCVFCHTPHGADANVKAPLWNRQVTTLSSYTMYESSSMDAAVDSAELGVSQACLSCHDGQIAFNALRNHPGSGNTAMGGTWTYSQMPTGRLTNLGTDLRDDHPISMIFTDAKSPSSASQTDTAGFATTTTVGTRVFVKREVNVNGTASNFQLPLYRNTTSGTAWRVQCPSCHDPHYADGAGSTNIELFLRTGNNQYSKLCRTCHIKDVNS